MKDYTQISFEERKKIYIYLEMKLTVSKIAEKLGRHKSAIYREIKRNSYENKYVGSVANNIAFERHSAKRKNKIKDNSLLQKYISESLKAGWSPEQISGRLRLEKKEYYACHESIYRYIYKEQKLQWYEYLHYKQKQRHKRCGRRSQVRYSGGKSIHERAQDIKVKFGHWEGDTVNFSGNKKVSITTLVERKTLVTLLAKNDTKTSAIVMGKIKNIIKSKPKKYWQTLAFDQGIEFADFRQIEGQTKCLVYYCDVSSPWQRGCNENTNGRIRKFLPRDIDINNVTDVDIEALAKKMNRTPRKKLGYLMPEEALKLELKVCCRT